MAIEPYGQMVDILFGYDTDIYFANDDLMTTTGIDFIEREIYKLLITMPGDWKNNPTIGASPNKYTGEQNTREIGLEIEQYVEKGLRLTVAPGIPRVRVVPTDRDKIMVFIDIQIGNLQKITMPFEFDYINGIKKFERIDSQVTEIAPSDQYDLNDISNLRRPNKYWSRMSYNATNAI